MKHIGILWVTVPWALFCINAIVDNGAEYFGPESMQHPLFTYINPPLWESEHFYETKDRKWLGDFLSVYTEKLYTIWADFIIIPSNSAHYALPYIVSPVPLMSIVDITIKECIKIGAKKVWILWVSVTMSDGLYEKPLTKQNIEVSFPTIEQQQSLNDLIYHDIICGKPTKQTTHQMNDIVMSLKVQWCDIFIAWCTEIPLVLDETCPLQYIDTTRLLSEKAFEFAIN